MYCPKCGTKNIDDASFCTKCGSRIEVAESQNSASSHQEQRTSNGTSTDYTTEITSRKAQEDREMLHDYLVTPLPEFRPEGQQQQGLVETVITGVAEKLGNILFNKKGVVGGTSESNVEKEKAKREAVFKQQTLLRTSAQYRDSKPWITYLTAIKLAPFLRFYEITTEKFSEFNDKQLLDELIRYADDLETRSSRAMPEEYKDLVKKHIYLESVREALGMADSVTLQMSISIHKEQILATLRGHSISIDRRFIPTPSMRDYSGLIIVGFALTIGLGFTTVVLVNLDSIAGWIILSTVLGAILGVCILFLTFRKSGRDKSALSEYETQMAYEETCIRDIKDQISSLCRDFNTCVVPILKDIGLTLDDTLNNIEGANDAIKNLVKYVNELRDYLIQT